MISQFERLAIREICNRCAPNLLPQVDHLRATSREFTGAGMYTRFELLGNLEPAKDAKNFYFPGSYILDSSSEANSAVILWINSGKISMLELTAIEGEVFPSALDGCKLDFGDIEPIDLTDFTYGPAIDPVNLSAGRR